MDPNPNNPQSNKGKSVSKAKKQEPMKVKYISSPIMVQASSESEFRAVVQELTGKDSPGSHPDPTAATGQPSSSTTTTRAPPGHGSGGDGSNYSSGFHQSMTWKDF